LNTVDWRRAPATSKPCRIECRRFAIAGSPGGRIAFIPAWNDNGAGRFSCDRSEPGARAGKKCCYISANKGVIVPAIEAWAQAAPWTFAFGLFFASVLLYSQAATTRALMPLGIALGIPPQFLIAMFPSVNGYFFIPTYGSLIAAINFDLSGTTRIGRYVLNHSFMIPGLVATAVAVRSGLLIAQAIY
jgi:hypothetical protein